MKTKFSKQSFSSSSLVHYRVSTKANLTLPFNLHEIIIGSILGDLFIEKPNKNCNSRCQFKQYIINKERIDEKLRISFNQNIGTFLATRGLVISVLASLLFACQAIEYLLFVEMDFLIVTCSLIVPIETNIKNKVVGLDPY